MIWSSESVKTSRVTGTFRNTLCAAAYRLFPRGESLPSWRESAAADAQPDEGARADNRARRVEEYTVVVDGMSDF